MSSLIKDGTANYNYDATGNLISDTGKGISNISYNFMNLTSKITQNGKTTNYTYAADGRKLTADSGGDPLGINKKHDYLSTGVYESDTLEVYLNRRRTLYSKEKLPSEGQGTTSTF